MPVSRRFAIRVLLLALSAVIFLGTGEAALRIIYRDGGRTTLGGPGGHPFEHLVVRDDLRGRFDVGPKRQGIPRIMVLGDSITWGQGVRDWHDVWPERVAEALERAGTPHEMAVFAMPGRDVASHVQEFERWAPEVRPDIVIYQWYVNDVELLEHRPSNDRWWQRRHSHRSLRRSSYLYYFLDDRLSKLLAPPDRSYVQYILEDFTPGSLEWAEFERYFHSLAIRAREAAAVRLLIIYPQVPFRERSPLQPIHDRLRVMAGAHRLSIPPAAWVRSAGAPVERVDARWRQGVQVPPSATGPVLETREYYMAGGSIEVLPTVWVDSPGAARVLGALEIVDHTTNQVIGSAPVPVPAGGPQWHEVPVRIDIPGRTGRAVRFRLSAAGTAGFTLGSIDVPVEYGMQVVDLTDSLNTFNTHASIFDAHPNERAHQVIAEKVLEALRETPRPD